MQKSLLSLLLIFLTSSFLFSQDNPTTPSGSEYCFQKKINSAGTWYTDNPAADIKHSYNALNYKIDLDLYSCFISPYPKSYKGSVILSFQADSLMTTLPLNAVNSSLVIDSVRMNGVSFTHTGNILTITLDHQYIPGETGQVKIYFRHNNVSDDAVYVSNGFFFTDCEPEGARKWMPCWDRPSDKATFDLRVKTPATVKLGSNGRLADSVKTADTIYYNWISNDPIATYLMVITGKVNYNLNIVYWHKLSNPLDSIPMRFYYNAGESLNGMPAVLLQMTTHYSQLFTEHPFEKNGFATLNNQFVWGGMENQTLTSLCPGCWSTSLIAHEFAHQWFGDMITCATWADIFLNEGFATFIEALWTEHTSGYTAYKQEINGNASSYMGSNPGWAISEPSWAVTTPSTSVLFNYAITYMKGSCVLHMLRYVMGDTKFFSAMSTYANDPAVKYKSAVISDFKGVCNAAYGADLSWFFDSWIYTPNHPAYANNYWIDNWGSGTYQIGFVAKQTQLNTPFHPMPLEIKFHFSTGTDSTVRVMNDANNQIFTWTFNRQPLTVTFDPNNNIVLKTATLTQIPPIPVELTSFTARAKDNFVILEWKTASELNNSGFEIQRRNSGSSEWVKAAFVAGHGTSNFINNYSYADYVSGLGTYYYRLKQIDLNGSFEYSNEISVAAGQGPEDFFISQNYPNPFNPVTSIDYQLPVSSHVSLIVVDVLGNQVASLVNEVKNAGNYTVQFDASGMASGVYYYKFTADNYSAVRKLVVLK